jgi:arylsulfatase A-like enzyme/Flp pilus assembly protein TadD
VIAVSAGLWYALDPAPQRLNVILISMDTTRADHLGCYGYDGIRTPNIDALADRSLRFERCFSPVPITLPSHTTMLSGLYPLRHSVRDNGTFSLPEEVPTIAGILGAAGWRTMGVVGAFPLTAQFGLSRDFDDWDEEFVARGRQILPLAFEQRPANRVTRTALRLLEDHAGEPFFLFVHYFDAHRPWEAPALYANRYRDAPYDAEIAFMDSWIGRLLDRVRELGLLENTVIVLTADHGEGLSDHEEETHSFLLYNETVRVPLLLSAPGLERGVVDRPVSLADIAPTILDLLGLDAPRQMDGHSLLSPPDDDRLIYMESLAGRLQHGWNDMRACVVGERKLVLGVQSELYDVAGDLGEHEDVSASEITRVGDLEARLRDFIEVSRAHISLAESFSVADAEVKEKLEALGYVVAADQERDWSELGPITAEGDPRKHIRLVEVQSIARDLINRGELPLVFEILDEASRQNPDDIELVRLRLTAHILAGESDEAVELAGRLLELSAPEARDLWLCALAHRQAGDNSGALVILERAEAIDPGGRTAISKAEVLLRMGRRREARDLLQALLDGEPCYREALLAMASLQRAAGNLNAVEEEYRHMVECEPRDARALFNLGNLRLEEGDLDGAQRLYESSLGADEGYAHARYGLALVHLERAEKDEAVAKLRRVIGAEPVNSPLGQRAAELLNTVEGSHASTER